MIDWADLEARNAPLNAFVDWDKSAATGDGPLAGMTIGIKSNIMVAGLPWTGGMGLYRNRIADRDAQVVQQLRGAGAAIVGTLNMHEAALGATTDNIFYGRTSNPHRIGHTPGGSSGGSGAAVAAGLCDAALGTDTLGSVRIPAAYNGVYGLKPTHGAVSNDGLAMLEPNFDCIGPLARSLDLLERVWRVIGPASGTTTPLTRLVYIPDLMDVAVEPGVATAYHRALERLSLPRRTLAFEDAITAIRMAGLVDAARWLIGDLGAARHEQADLISPELHFILNYAEPLQPQPALLARTKARLITALGNDGVLLLPTAPQAAFPHGIAPSNQADFTCLASIAGLPAIAIPVGLDDQGLPVGVQVVGPAHSECALFALARSLDTILQGYVPPKGD